MSRAEDTSRIAVITCIAPAGALGMNRNARITMPETDPRLASFKRHATGRHPLVRIENEVRHGAPQGSVLRVDGARLADRLEGSLADVARDFGKLNPTGIEGFRERLAGPRLRQLLLQVLGPVFATELVQSAAAPASAELAELPVSPARSDHPTLQALAEMLEVGPDEVLDAVAGLLATDGIADAVDEILDAPLRRIEDEVPPDNGEWGDEPEDDDGPGDRLPDSVVIARGALLAAMERPDTITSDGVRFWCEQLSIELPANRGTKKEQLLTLARAALAPAGEGEPDPGAGDGARDDNPDPGPGDAEG